MMNSAEVKQRMEKILELLRQDLGTLKTGRATPALVEQIRVEAYGTTMSLMELATISAPDSSQLLITPFDQSNIRAIEKALSMDRGLGINPAVDGASIRLRIPPLTTERREALVKQIGQKLEAARISVRQVRHDEMRKIDDSFTDKQISEDVKFRGEQDLQKIVDDYNEKIEEMGERKEQDLMSI